MFDSAPSNWVYHKPKWDDDLEIMEDQLFDLNNAKTVTPELALYDVAYETPKDYAINNAYMTLTDDEFSKHLDIGMVRKTNPHAKGTYEHLLNAATNLAKFKKRKGVLSGRDLMSPDVTKHLWNKYEDKELFAKNVGMHLYGTYQPGDIMSIKSPTYKVPETKSILFNPSILSDDGKMNIDWNSEDISFAEGGQVEPDPLEVLERSRPKINGIPINDKPLSGTDPLGELYLNLVSGNAVRKAVMNGINGIVRKSFYNNYKDFLKAGWNRHKAYDYASPEIGINVLPGVTKGFDYTIRGANYTHAAEKFIE